MRLESAAEFLQAVVNARDNTIRNELARAIPGLTDYEISQRARLVIGPHGEETLELDGKPLIRFGLITFSVKFDEQACTFRCEVEQPYERVA